MTETTPRESAVLASAAEGLRIVPCQAATLAVLALIAFTTTDAWRRNK